MQAHSMFTRALIAIRLSSASRNIPECDNVSETRANFVYIYSRAIAGFLSPTFRERRASYLPLAIAGN